MSHTVRLLDEGFQLLSTGKISFPFTGQALEDIMSVKLGKTNVEDIPDLVNRYKERLSELEENCTLPKTADYEAIKKSFNTLVLTLYSSDLFDFMDNTGLYWKHDRARRY